MLTKETLDKLDEASFARVKSTLQFLEASADPEKIFELEMKDTIADDIMAAVLVSLFHNSKVDLHIKASGNLSPGATIIAAAGSPGFRSATCTTKFQLSDSGQKLGKKNPSLAEKNVIQFLSKFCEDKKRKIKDAIISYGSVYATDAVSLTIIDNVSDFKDKYAAKKETIKAERKNKSRSKKAELVDVNAVSPLSDKENEELLDNVEKQIKTPGEEVIKA